MKTALRDRSRTAMYRPGKTAALIADLSPGLALVTVGAYVIIGGMLGWLGL